MKKIYFVTFDTQRASIRETSQYVFHCLADNASEAKELCKAAWPKLHSAYNAKVPHQFHLHAKRSRIQDADLLGCRSWANVPVRGRDCLDFVCTSVTRWQP